MVPFVSSMYTGDGYSISELYKNHYLHFLTYRFQSIPEDDEHEPNAGMVDVAHVAATEYKSLGM